MDLTNLNVELGGEEEEEEPYVQVTYYPLTLTGAGH